MLVLPPTAGDLNAQLILSNLHVQLFRELVSNFVDAKDVEEYRSRRENVGG